MQVHEYKPREFSAVEDNAEILELVKTRIASKTIYIKNLSERIPASIRDCQPDKTLKIITEDSFKPSGQKITVYALLDRYIEIELAIMQEIDRGLLLCKIEKTQKAAQGRRHLRFKLTPDHVLATNFRVSRQSFDVGSFTIPTSIKIVLDQFQSTNSRMSDIVKVDIFQGDNDHLLKAVKKSGKTVFIPDVSSAESYLPLSDEFINCSQVYGSDLKTVIQKNVEKGYKSIIIVPVLYIDETEKVIPFGYIQLISKSSALTLDNITTAREHSLKLVERIRDANIVLLQTKQEIMDISRGGMKLKITDGELKKLLQKSRGFIFDIVFKLQAPITIYGEIRTSGTDENGNLFIGIDFQGNSSRNNEMKRFYSYLDPMEADYKAKLKKALNGK